MASSIRRIRSAINTVDPSLLPLKVTVELSDHRASEVPRAVRLVASPELVFEQVGRRDFFQGRGDRRPEVPKGTPVAFLRGSRADLAFVERPGEISVNDRSPLPRHEQMLTGGFMAMPEVCLTRTSGLSQAPWSVASDSRSSVHETHGAGIAM